VRLPNGIVTLIDAMDWTHSANSLRRDLSSDWETIWVDAAGRTPNQCARDQGRGWKVGVVDAKKSMVQLHKKKARK